MMGSSTTIRAVVLLAGDGFGDVAGADAAITEEVVDWVGVLCMIVSRIRWKGIALSM